jgi:hypothetical protein
MKYSAPVQRGDGSTFKAAGEGPLSPVNFRGRGVARSEAPAAPIAPTAPSAPVATATAPPPAEPNYIPGENLQDSYSGQQPAPTAPPIAPPEMAYGFDRFGKPKWMPKEQARELTQAGYQAAGYEGDFADDFDDAQPPTDQSTAAPPISPAPPTAPAPGTSPAAPQDELTALRAQVTQQNQLILAIAQAQMEGKPLSAVLGQPQQPAAPVAPDPSQVDWYDADQVADYHRANNAYMQATIEQRVQQAIGPYSKALDETKWVNQFQQIQARYGENGPNADPAFKQKAAAAIKLVENDQPRNGGTGQLSIPAAYERINEIAATLGYVPQIATPANPANPSQPSTQQTPIQQQSQSTARTLTAEQAAEKAEQARRLPRRGNAVTGAGRQAIPSHIKGLGSKQAWRNQYGRDS